jgi:hypothetical protein
LQEATLGQGWSEATSDFHAFLFWPQTSLLVVPFQQQAVGFTVKRAAGIQQLGSVTHQNGSLGYAPSIHRSAVIGDSVVTVSDAGLESSSLSTLAPQGWVSFPAAPQPVPLPVPLPGAGRVGIAVATVAGTTTPKLGATTAPTK